MTRPGKAEACAVAALALTLVLSSCGGGDGNAGGETPVTTAPVGQPVEGGDLVDLQNFAQGGPEHIDPALASTINSAQIPELLYDGLTQYDFSNPTEPELKGNVAESFSSNDTADVWTFKLRKDVTYSDGTPVVASDFKYAWEQVANPDLASDLSYLMAFVKGAKAVQEGQAKEIEGLVADDAAGTLTVTLEQPFADFAGVVTHAVFSPKPKAAYSALASPTDWEQQVMVGNGPFKMTKAWNSEDQEIVLERNDKYFGGLWNHKAYLDKVTFKVSKDVDSAYTDFEAGNGDTALIPSGKYKETIAKYPHATDNSLGAYFFAFNQENPQVGGPKNLKLRQAISLAVDRSAINEAAYNGARRLATGLTPPGVPGFKAGLCGDYCPETAKADDARKLLDEWKAEGGQLTEPIKLNFNAGSGHEEVVNTMVANLRDVGIEAVPDPRNTKTYFSEMRRGDCVVCRAGWIWDYPLYDNAVYAEFDSRSIDGDNLSRLNDPEIDKLIDQARAERDDTKRYDLYRQAEKRGLDVLAEMPLNWYTGQVLYKDNVTNLYETPGQFVLYENIWLKS